jgi:hydrogenase/urease accessory protein HupE
MSHSCKSRLPLYAFVIFSFTLFAVPADAHHNSTGMGPFYDGLMHFLMSPEDIVPVLALALLAGLRGANHGRWALFTLPVAWFLGGLAGLTAAVANPHPVIAAAWFLLLGGLLAADAKLSLRTTAALAALLGLYHGYLNGTGMGQFETAAVAVLGLVFAVFVLVALAAAFVVRLHAHWTRIAVRVAGSWIAASGLLMFGWAIPASETCRSRAELVSLFHFLHCGRFCDGRASKVRHSSIAFNKEKPSRAIQIT